jgi:1-acyl-sn-glycerol-3-phosphate acyltransferase
VLYSAVRALARFWIWFFFKAVDVRHPERVPERGPVLLCINHPNNLIDSLLVGAVVGRPVHFLATAALFKNALVGRFLLACGAIPVYRRQDDPDKMERNVDAFRACFQVLERGEVIAIYPEGTTHAEPRVQRIKTGASRIALDYEVRRAAPDGRVAPLVLVPVGLTFEARKSFRGRVLVSFGAALAVAPYAEKYRDDPGTAVDGLTNAIQWAMEAEVVSVKRMNSAAFVRAVEDLYRSELVRELEDERGLSPRQIDVFRLSQGIADATAHFEEREPERVERIWQRILAYRALLAAYRVKDVAVQARLAPRPGARQRLRRGWQSTLGLPIFAYGVIVNALPFFVPRWLARRIARKETDYATTRFLLSIVALPICWGAETWLVWRLAGPLVATVFLLSLPVSGILAHRYLVGAGRLGAHLRLGALSVTRHQTATRLLEERQAIMDELDRAKNDYLAATKGSTF